MELKAIIGNIFHLMFPNNYELASTFLRFQEHYESPEFRGRIFTRDEYKAWYTTNSQNGKKTGEFTYYEDWGGFNVPSHIFEPFYEKKFDPLIAKERALLDLFEDKRGTKFYVIGTTKDVKTVTLEHEIAHGLFYTEPEYREEVIETLGTLNPNTRQRIESWLSASEGYHPSVIQDEVHAYLLDLEFLRKFVQGLGQASEVSERLNSIFQKYYRDKLL